MTASCTVAAALTTVISEWKVGLALRDVCAGYALFGAITALQALEAQGASPDIHLWPVKK